MMRGMTHALDLLRNQEHLPRFALERQKLGGCLRARAGHLWRWLGE